MNRRKTIYENWPWVTYQLIKGEKKWHDLNVFRHLIK